MIAPDVLGDCCARDRVAALHGLVYYRIDAAVALGFRKPLRQFTHVSTFASQPCRRKQPCAYNLHKLRP